MRAFSYAWSFSVTWQRWRLHHSKTPWCMQSSWRCVLGNGVIAEVSYCWIGIFVDPLLLLWPWPWLGDLRVHIGHVSPLDIRMCNGLPTLRLSKFIVWQTYRQRQTGGNFWRKLLCHKISYAAYLLSMSLKNFLRYDNRGGRTRLKWH